MRSRRLILLLLGTVAFGPLALAATQEDSAEIDQILAALDCPKPKPRVAIYSFHATGKLAAFEGYNVGDALAAQLATELTRTGCFIVLDRTGLSNVLREQELALAGVVNSDTGAEAGRVIGAEVIIKGAVTEFESNKRGRGLNIGLGLPDIPLGVRLGRRGNRAHVAMDLSIIDASSGEVRAAHRVEADSTSGGWTLGLDHERGSIGGDTFAKSPLGIASRNALGQAIVQLAGDLQGVPWRSQIIDAVGELLFVNAGRATGIEAGDTFTVATVVHTLVDPSTGLLLDTVEREVGTLKIVAVEEKYAVAEAVGKLDARRGDFVYR